MRAVVVTRHGGHEVLELQDVPEPEPGPGELLVLVRVLGDDRARVELDHGQRDPLAVHGSGGDPVPDRERPELRYLAERARRIASIRSHLPIFERPGIPSFFAIS